ncbi:MAG TPA: energy transducer TonB [Flavobacterium sp.]|jgi:protein TonB
MKVIATIILFCIPLLNFAQESTAPVITSATYDTSMVDVLPTFPGGIQAFAKYIGANFQQPDVEGLQGRVFMTFVIDADGSVVDVKVLSDIGYGTGDEAIRVLRKSPKWNPGEVNGQKVRVNFSMPIAINTIYN